MVSEQSQRRGCGSGAFRRRRDVGTAAAPWAQQRSYGQGKRHADGVGRRSVVGAAEARGRVKPRSSVASVPPSRAGAWRGHLGRLQVRRSGGAGLTPPQRAVS